MEGLSGESGCHETSEGVVVLVPTGLYMVTSGGTSGIIKSEEAESRDTGVAPLGEGADREPRQVSLVVLEDEEGPLLLDVDSHSEDNAMGTLERSVHDRDQREGRLALRRGRTDSVFGDTLDVGLELGGSEGDEVEKFELADTSPVVEALGEHLKGFEAKSLVSPEGSHQVETIPLGPTRYWNERFGG